MVCGCRPAAADDVEEGEIALPARPGGGDRTWGPQERAATALNWALYEALSGDGAAALAAAEAALGIAEAAGCDMVRSCSFLCSACRCKALGGGHAALPRPPNQSSALPLQRPARQDMVIGFASPRGYAAGHGDINIRCG